MSKAATYLIVFLVGVIVGAYTMNQYCPNQAAQPCPQLALTTTQTTTTKDTVAVDLSPKNGIPQPGYITEPQIPEQVDTQEVIEQHYATAYYCDEYKDTNYHLVIEDSINQNRITWRKPTLTLVTTTNQTNIINNTYHIEPKMQLGLGAALNFMHQGPASVGPSLMLVTPKYFYAADVLLYPNKGLNLKTGIILWRK